MTSFVPVVKEAAGTPVITVEEVKYLEKFLAYEGTRLPVLMERAGTGLTTYLNKTYPEAKRVVICCGSGNNGGDGWVVGKQLAKQDVQVDLVSTREPLKIAKYPANKAVSATLAETEGMDNFRVHVCPDGSSVSDLMSQADVVVDALLGTGFEHDTLTEPTATYVSCMVNAVRQRNCCGGAVPPAIIAADVPSGLSADTGKAAEPCVVADATVTMLANKRGLMAKEGPAHCGTIMVAQLAGDIEEIMEDSF